VPSKKKIQKSAKGGKRMAGFRTISLALAACAFLVAATVAATPKDGEEELALPAPVANMTEAQWGAFSDNLVRALDSDHDGMQQAAMRYAIQYADNVDVGDATIDLMAIYRNHEDENTRRMAVVALASLKSGFVVNYLRLHQTHEKSVPVKRTIKAVLRGIADGSF